MTRHEKTVIELRDVSIRYDTDVRWLGEGITFDVAAGETVLLLGPSGCGKSTLMLALPGLIPHSVPSELRGTVYANGVDTRQVHPGKLAQTVGIVFQDPDSQVITDTLLDEVCFGLENMLIPVDQIEQIALSALQEVGLAASRQQALVSPEALSGGQRQKLAIACAIALNPQILVLDEPTANLDPVASREFYRLLARLQQRDPERVIVLVEHELDEAVERATRVVALDHEGRVIADGTPRAVLGGRASELQEIGIWLPTATRVALQLDLADSDGVYPLNAEQFREMLASDSAQLRVMPAGDHSAMADHQPSTVDVQDHPIIRCKNVSVEASKKTILAEVNLDIYAGEFIAIAGTNGAGKSTFTRVIAGLQGSSAGEILLAGQPIGKLNSRQLSDKVGYVFQNPEHQFIAGTVSQELAYGLTVRELQEEDIAREVSEMLARFDLTRYADVSPFLLSHGEKRRLSVATALITKPEVLILDEPTFGQDHARAQEIISVAAELHASGITVIVVTHDLQLIADYAQRIALFHAGRFVCAAPVAEVFSNTTLLDEVGLLPPPVYRLAQELRGQNPSWDDQDRVKQFLRGGE